ALSDLDERLNSTAHGSDVEEYRYIVADGEADENKRPIFRDELQRCYEQATLGITDPADTRAIRAGMKCFTTPALRDPLLAALLDEPQEGLEFTEHLMYAVPRDWLRMRSQETATVAVLEQAYHLTGFSVMDNHLAPR